VTSRAKAQICSNVMASEPHKSCSLTGVGLHLQADSFYDSGSAITFIDQANKV